VLSENLDLVRSIGLVSRSSGRVALRWATVAWFQDGKMSRVSGFLRRREALEAVGLARPDRQD